MLELLRGLNNQIAVHDKEIVNLSKDDDNCKKLKEIPGVGVLTASIVSITLGNGSRFKNGRHFASYLGLTPRQSSSGGKSVLGGISKRGDKYIRKLLVQGAQSVLRRMRSLIGKKKDWLEGVRNRRGHCKAAVALANKHARIMWRLIAKNEDFNESLAWR